MRKRLFWAATSAAALLAVGVGAGVGLASGGGGGANGQCPGGPYCASSTGAASANGSGGGASANGSSTSTNGEPCAGCVGSADNKNPPGPMPSAAHTNAGYECDSNNGIAQGNPAHTGCTSGSTTST